MRFAKRKAASAVLAAILLLPLEARAGFPAVDFPSIPPALMENIRKANETYGMIGIYTKWIDNNVNGYLLKIQTSIGVNIFGTQTELNLREDIHNLRVQEGTQPLPDICRKVTVKPTIETRKNNKVYVSKAADAFTASSSASFTVNNKDRSTKVDEISEEESLQKNIAINKAAEYSNSIVGNMKALRPDLTNVAISDEKRKELAQELVDAPMSTQGDYAMNPNAFLIYEPHQQIAMQDMVRLIVPPLITHSEASAIDETDVVHDMAEQAKRAMISSILSGNIAKRIPNEDGVSELSLINQYASDIYKGNIGADDGIKGTLATRMSANTETMTGSPIKRERAIMMASQLYFSIEEHKENLEKEYILAMKLLKQVDEL